MAVGRILAGGIHHPEAVHSTFKGRSVDLVTKQTNLHRLVADHPVADRMLVEVAVGRSRSPRLEGYRLEAAWRVKTFGLRGSNGDLQGIAVVLK